MSKKNKRSAAEPVSTPESGKNRVEIPQIGEPLENPNFVTPTALYDPLGSWTGRPEKPFVQPEQDADDL